MPPSPSRQIVATGVDGVAAVDRIGVAEAHGDVLGEVGAEALGLHRVDVREQL
jgi:hypothetical protein